MNVISISSARPKPITPHEEFCRARQSMIIALQNWLKNDAEPSDVAEEIDGTHSAIDIILAMWRAK